jgi:hypothetical protein
MIYEKAEKVNAIYVYAPPISNPYQARALHATKTNTIEIKRTDERLKWHAS